MTKVLTILIQLNSSKQVSQVNVFHAEPPAWPSVNLYSSEPEAAVSENGATPVSELCGDKVHPGTTACAPHVWRSDFIDST